MLLLFYFYSIVLVSVVLPEASLFSKPQYIFSTNSWEDCGCQLFYLVFKWWYFSSHAQYIISWYIIYACYGTEIAVLLWHFLLNPHEVEIYLHSPFMFIYCYYVLKQVKNEQCFPQQLCQTPVKHPHNKLQLDDKFLYLFRHNWQDGNEKVIGLHQRVLMMLGKGHLTTLRDMLLV